MDAGLRTESLQKMANTQYIRVGQPTLNACSNTGFSGAVSPVKSAPGCVSAGLCAQTTNVKEQPYIVLPCCPPTYLSTFYVSPCKSVKYQATTNPAPNC